MTFALGRGQWFSFPSCLIDEILSGKFSYVWCKSKTASLYYTFLRCYQYILWVTMSSIYCQYDCWRSFCIWFLGFFLSIFAISLYKDIAFNNNCVCCWSLYVHRHGLHIYLTINCQYNVSNVNSLIKSRIKIIYLSYPQPTTPNIAVNCYVT